MMLTKPFLLSGVMHVLAAALLLSVALPASAEEGTIETTQSILFNGSPLTWKDKLTGNTDTAGSAIITAIQTALYRPAVTVTAEVKSMEPYPADPSFTSMGNGNGGLLAKVYIVEEVGADAVHPYDRDEINSILFGLSVPELSTLYGGQVSVVTVRTDLDYSLQCTSLCKGMIATGVILGALMLVFFLILIIYSCCPSCFTKLPKGATDLLPPDEDQAV